MEPVFFSSSLEFRKWLEVNHQLEKELIVGFHKIGTGKPSMTWSESVDQAICFGWIDGIRRSHNAEAYTIRFTPRKSKSIWSAVNIKKVEELTGKGLMQTAGITAYEKKEAHRSAIYAFENKLTVLPPHYEEKFKTETNAWDWFEKQAAGYKKIALHWVMSAKQEVTRNARMETLINDSAAELKIKSQRR